MQTKTDVFSSLHNRLYASIYNFIRLRISRKEEVEDLVQDTFLKAFNSWKEIPEENTAKNFLFHIARQKMIDHFRSGRNNWEELSNDEMLDEYLDPKPLPEDIFLEDERKKISQQLLQTLSGDERQIVYLRYIKEMSYEEVANVFRISEELARQKVRRALMRIKKVVKEKNIEI